MDVREITDPRVKGWVSLAIGTLCLVIGLGFGFTSLRLSFGSAHAQGTVIKMERGTGSDRGDAYPIVEYEVAGRKYTYKGVGSDFWFVYFSVGKKVTVVYKVDRPEVARIDSFFDRWLFPLVFCGGGAFVAGLGARALWTTRRPTAEPTG